MFHSFSLLGKVVLMLVVRVVCQSDRIEEMEVGALLLVADVPEAFSFLFCVPVGTTSYNGLLLALRNHCYINKENL